MDAKIAFINGDLEEKVHMQPPGYSRSPRQVFWPQWALLVQIKRLKPRLPNLVLLLVLLVVMKLLPFS